MAATKTNADFSIIYMIDPPGLLTHAIPLLLSIRKHHPDTPIYPYVPKDKVDLLPERVRRIHAEMDAPIQVLTRELAFNMKRYPKPYLHGHKILAAAEKRPHEFCIFLDTDVILRKPLTDQRLFQADKIGAVPESVSGYAQRFMEVWEASYAIFDMEVPKERVTMLRSDRETPPYCNAGVIAFPEVLPNGERFGEFWLDTAMTLDFDDSVDHERKRPWLDQASLPLTVYRAGCRFEILPTEFNYPLDANQFPPNDDAIVYHYHGFERLEETGSLNEVEDLVCGSGMFQSFEHFTAPMEARREQINIHMKKFAALADELRSLKPKIAELRDGGDREELLSLNARMRDAKSDKQAERAKVDTVLEQHFYDDDWGIRKSS